MTDQKPPRQPGRSSKVAGIRQMAQSPEYQRELEEQRRTREEDAAAAARLAEAQGDALAALKAAGFAIKGISCSEKTARQLAVWVQQHTLKAG
jgi:hypothetical protein